MECLLGCDTVVWQTVSIVSEDLAAFIFVVEEASAFKMEAAGSSELNTKC
jgi:hypothetical protein